MNTKIFERAEERELTPGVLICSALSTAALIAFVVLIFVAGGQRGATATTDGAVVSPQVTVTETAETSYGNCFDGNGQAVYNTGPCIYRPTKDRASLPKPGELPECGPGTDYEGRVDVTCHAGQETVDWLLSH